MVKQYLSQEIFMTSKDKLFAVDYDKRIWYERNIITDEISEVTIPSGASPYDMIVSSSRLNLIQLIDSLIIK